MAHKDGCFWEASFQGNLGCTFGMCELRWHVSCREDEGLAGGEKPPCAPQKLLTLVMESVTLGFRSDLPEPPALWTRPGHRSPWAPADPRWGHGFVAAPGGAHPQRPEVTPRLSHESSNQPPPGLTAVISQLGTWPLLLEPEPKSTPCLTRGLRLRARAWADRSPDTILPTNPDWAPQACPAG